MRRAKRQFTPEQKANIVTQIDTDRKNGMKFNDAVAKHDIYGSLYMKWKRQLAVGVKSSLRNGKAPVDAEKKKLMSDIKKLQQIVLSQSLAISELKKEMNLEYLTI
jgi:transposase-like protein